MSKPDKKILVIITFVFAFQLLFPQYSYAQVIDYKKSSTERSLLAIANSSQPIMFDRDNTSGFDVLPESNWRQPVRKIKIVVTAYSSTLDQCDSTPFITANGKHVTDGIVATNFLSFGTKVKIPEIFGDKVFSVEDRMNQRYHQRMDIWMPTREEAKKFGVKYLEIEIY